MKRLAVLILTGLLSSIATLTAAQAAVVVRVRTAEGGPGEARVVLTRQDGDGRYECETQSGTCSIPGVPAGRYAVSAEPRGGGQAPVPRTLPIPPSGDVTVSVTLR